MSQENDLDLADKLNTVRRNTEDSRFDLPGFVVNVEEIGDRDGIEITYSMPDEKTTDSDRFDWPIEWDERYEIVRLVEADWFPFGTASFDLETLMDEELPVVRDGSESYHIDVPDPVYEEPRLNRTTQAYHSLESVACWARQHAVPALKTGGSITIGLAYLIVLIVFAVGVISVL